MTNEVQYWHAYSDAHGNKKKSDFKYMLMAEIEKAEDKIERVLGVIVNVSIKISIQCVLLGKKANLFLGIIRKRIERKLANIEMLSYRTIFLSHSVAIVQKGYCRAKGSPEESKGSRC